MSDTERLGALDVARPCHPPTTHRYRRIGQSNILGCMRCGQGKRDIVGVTVGPAPLDVERLTRALDGPTRPIREDLGIEEDEQRWLLGLAAAIARAYEEAEG